MTILPQLEHDLFEAAKEHLPGDLATGTSDQDRNLGRLRRPARLRHGLARTARTLPMLLAVAVTMIIAAFALIVLNHHRRPRPSAPATVQSAPATVQSARRQLVQMLGVLRRPQTKADLDAELVPGPFAFIAVPEQYVRRGQRPPAGLEHRLAKLGHPQLDRALIRVVRIPAWQAKVGILPATWQPSPSSPDRSEGLDLELWIGSKPTIPPSSDIATGPPVASIDTVRDHGLAVTDNVRGQDLLDGVLLVPDGVARVTLRVTRVIQPPLRVTLSEFGTATATVHDNIAAFQLAIGAATSRDGVSGEFGTSVIAQETWLDASGNVLKRTTTTFDVVINVKGKTASPRSPRTARRQHR